MNRRRFLGTTALATAAAGLSLRGHAQPQHPNVLFIIVDDLNDWIGCLGGHPQAHTPNFDVFAGQSVLFTNAHCGAPACSPARANLLTSILPSTSGVYDNPDNWLELIPDAISITRHFGNYGYGTYSSGKIEHNVEPGVWNDRLGEIRSASPPQMQLNRLQPTQSNRFDWGPLDLDRRQSADYLHGAWISERLLAPPPSPWLLAYGPVRPHAPQYVPRSILEKYPPDEIQLPPFLANDLDDIPAYAQDLGYDFLHPRVVSNKQWHAGVAGYLACVEYMDWQVGQVLNAWQDSPARDDTIVLLTSDQGWHLGEKMRWEKFTLWEEATRIPLIVHVPWMNNHGVVCGEAVGLGDIFPTLCDLCDLPVIPDQFEGESFIAQLENPASSRVRPALTTWLPHNHSVRDERWRYTRYEDGSEELYDHDNDPDEWTNLAGDPQYRTLMDQLAQWMPQDG